MRSTKEIRPLIISRTLPFLGGREVIVDKLVKFFSNRRRVAVLTPDEYPRAEGVSVCSTESTFSQILDWAKKQKVDVISCHTFYLSDFAFKLSRELKVPLVYTLHGVFIDFYDKKYGGILKQIYKNSSVVVTVSDGYKKTLGDFLGSHKRLVTIKNGIGLSSIDRPQKTSGFYRRKHSIPENKFVVVIPARLHYIKGLDYVIEAANKIESKEILFVVCSPKGRGDDEERAYKSRLLASLNNCRDVIFRCLGHEEMLEFYRSADIVLLPSLIEGISISVLEAMASRKIVVATRVGGNTEIIRDGENGYLISPKNVNDIVASITNIQQTDFKKMGEKARQTVEDQFLEERMFEEYEHIFHTVKNENQ